MGNSCGTVDVIENDKNFNNIISQTIKNMDDVDEDIIIHNYNNKISNNILTSEQVKTKLKKYLITTQDKNLLN